MEKIAFIICLLAVSGCVLWGVFKVLEQSTIRTIHIDGLRVVWYERGWSYASPHVYEWVGGKWRYAGRGESIHINAITLGSRQSVTNLSRCATIQVAEYIYSWDERKMSRSPDE